MAGQSLCVPVEHLDYPQGEKCFFSEAVSIYGLHSMLGHHPGNPRVASTLLRPCLSCFQSRLLKPAVPKTLLEIFQNTTAEHRDDGEVSSHPKHLLIYLCFKLKQKDLNWTALSLLTCSHYLVPHSLPVLFVGSFEGRAGRADFDPGRFLSQGSSRNVTLFLEQVCYHLILKQKAALEHLWE